MTALTPTPTYPVLTRLNDIISSPRRWVTDVDSMGRPVLALVEGEMRGNRLTVEFNVMAPVPIPTEAPIRLDGTVVSLVGALSQGAQDELQRVAARHVQGYQQARADYHLNMLDSIDQNSTEASK